MPLPLARMLPRVLIVSFFCCDSAIAGEADVAGFEAKQGGAVDDYFRDEVWAKVAAQNCLKCHKAGGDAEDTKLVLQDPSRDPHPERLVSLQHNRAAFASVAARQTGGKSRLLLKATGKLDHEGKEVVKPDSMEYRILEEFVRRLNAPADAKPVVASDNAPPFFEGVAMLDDRRLLRRATLSLAGRLPTAEETAAIEERGLPALDGLLDSMMKEDAFYERLAEAFNDIFLVRGYGDGAESALSYDNFSKTRLWTQKYDLSSIADEKERQKARYKLDADYREALLREPLELIKHIVREDRPFTEIVTADYIMESPYTARGYGNFDELRERFRNVDDPFEYIPVRLSALKHREKGKDQVSPTGFYPHAGMLTTFQYLRRYPTTETNRNRLRGRMYFEHFLGIDVLELAARVTDAAAVTAKFEIPTMQAAECVVCHKTLDPVAGLFQDYYSLEGVFGPRKDGWFKDMFGPGFEGEDLPPEQRWRALQWLGERTAKDPRFATTMVEHVYYVLTGRKVLRPPKAIDDPLFEARQRAYQAQRREIDAVTARFVKANFNLKEAFKAWAASSFYRADALATALADPKRKAELDDIGVARMLGPEQLERKIAAIFGKPWGRLKEQVALLYGGIDSKEVTERAADPSGAMGALQRTMANDVACKNVAADFTLAPEQRRLFPRIEPDALPGEMPETDQLIRGAIVHLHQLILGRFDSAGSAEVQRTFDLFTGILADARERKGIEPLENYSCRVASEQRFKDPTYTVRAWRGVVTYLLRQREFLYE
jgi:hypothetical protein